MLPGYDNLTGTDDDFLARCKSGRIESLEIPDRSAFSAAASRIEARAAETLPKTQQGQALLGDLKDLWGNPIQYELIDSSHARLSSAGPDKRAKTKWDVGIVLEKVGNEAPSRDSWLARRKRQLGLTDAPVEAGFRRVEFSGGQSKLEGAAYFRFFTWLVLGTAVVFIPFAMLYRPRTYLHD